jgi:hypothetical protein
MANSGNSVTLKVDSKDFDHAMMRMFNETNKSAKEVLNYAGQSYVNSARKMTPTAKKSQKRDLEKVLVTGKKKIERWDVTIRTQANWEGKKVPLYGPKSLAEAKKHELAQIKAIGAAKKSWLGVLRDLGKAVPMEKVGRVSSATPSGSGLQTIMTLLNRLSYLLKIAPNVDDEAKRKAAKDMIIRMDKVIEKSWK